MSDDGPLTLDCQHGTGVACVVCRHVVTQDVPALGFVENSSDPHDLQGWCDACEALFLVEEGLTERFRAFNDFALVCEICYERIKARHAVRP